MFHGMYHGTESGKECRTWLAGNGAIAKAASTHAHMHVQGGNGRCNMKALRAGGTLLLLSLRKSLCRE